MLASLALVAVVLVGGGVFAWLRLAPPSRHHTRALAARKPAVTTTARPGPTISLPGLTSPLDVNRPPADPFSGTPAEHWADGAAGITIPAARAHGPYTAAQVRSAYETTRDLLIAGNLDWPTLRGGAPKAFEKTDHRADERLDSSASQSTGAATRFSTAGDSLPTASGHNSKVFEMDLTPGRYLLKWSAEGEGGFFSIHDESEGGGKGRVLAYGNPPNPSSEEKIIRLAESGRHLLSVDANNLDWTVTFTPI